MTVYDRVGSFRGDDAYDKSSCIPGWRCLWRFMTELVRSEVTMLMTELLRPEVTMSPIVPVYEDTRWSVALRPQTLVQHYRVVRAGDATVQDGVCRVRVEWLLCVGGRRCGTLLLGLKQLPWRAKDTGRGTSGPAASPRLRLAGSFATPCNCERHHRRLYSQHQARCIYGWTKTGSLAVQLRFGQLIVSQWTWAPRCQRQWCVGVRRLLAHSLFCKPRFTRVPLGVRHTRHFVSACVRVLLLLRACLV